MNDLVREQLEDLKYYTQEFENEIQVENPDRHEVLNALGQLDEILQSIKDLTLEMFN